MDRKTGLQSPIKHLFLSAFPHTIPVLTGYLILGAAYGLLMRSAGYGIFWTAVMSVLAFAGSIQFAAVGLLTSTFDPFQAFFLSLMVNARHLFYGLSMLGKYSGMGKARAFLIFALTDETYSVACSIEAPKEVNAKHFYVTISLLNYLYWIIGGIAGSLIGMLITFDTGGLDFVLTALFVVLFLEQWKKRGNRLPCIIGLGCSALSVILFGAQSFILPAMAAILAFLALTRRKLCD